MIFNPTADSADVTLPDGEWTVYVNDVQAGTDALDVAGGSVSVAPISAMVLVRTGDTAPETRPGEVIGEADGETAILVASSTWTVWILVIAVVAVIVVAILFINKKRKQK